MAHFSKFKIIFALKENINGGQFYSEQLKYGYFNNLQIMLAIIRKSQIKERKKLEKLFDNLRLSCLVIKVNYETYI